MAENTGTNIPTIPDIHVVPADGDSPDKQATIALLKGYTDDNGFHCPKCGETITDPNEAVQHLANELNKSLAQMSRALKKER